MIAYHEFPHYDNILWIKHMCFEMVKEVQMYAKEVVVCYYPHSGPKWRLSTSTPSQPPTLKSCQVMFE